MPDRSRKRPTDLNALAASIVADATDEDKPDTPEDTRDPEPCDLNALVAPIVADATDEDKPEPADDGKDPAAVSLGRRGGLKGGKARAAKLTAEQRSEIARKAAATRWKNSG